MIIYHDCVAFQTPQMQKGNEDRIIRFRNIYVLFPSLRFLDWGQTFDFVPFKKRKSVFRQLRKLKSYLEKYPWNTLAAFLPRVCSQKWKWSTWISSSFVADQKDSKHSSSSKIFQNSNFLDNFSSPIFLCVLIWKRHGILLWTKGKLFSCYSRKRKEVKYVLPRWPILSIREEVNMIQWANTI